MWVNVLLGVISSFSPSLAGMWGGVEEVRDGRKDGGVV